jgi:ribonuclease BN (tRNA processing enzyme)
LAVVAGGTPYLVDAGAGIVRRASAAHAAGVKALEVTSLELAFITHLHSDHTIGLPDLMLTPWVLGRQPPLRVFGPPGTAAMTARLTRAFSEDIDVRLGGQGPPRSPVRAKDCTPGLAYEDDNITVKAFPARHGSWEHAFGYRLSAPELEICVSGDTAPHPEMKRHYRGCDILVHEVYSAAGLKRRPETSRPYHRASHTSTLELARIAGQVKPRLLVLTHLLFWGTTEAQLLAEVAGAYSGRVIVGRDLTFIGISAGFVSVRGGREGKGSFKIRQLGRGATPR